MKDNKKNIVAGIFRTVHFVSSRFEPPAHLCYTLHSMPLVCNPTPALYFLSTKKQMIRTIRDRLKHIGKRGGKFTGIVVKSTTTK